MGETIEFNWLLKLKPDQGLSSDLVEGGSYEFSKKGRRSYPIEMPILLVNSQWEAVARVVIQQYTVSRDSTTGKYRVLKKFSVSERSAIGEELKESFSK